MCENMDSDSFNEKWDVDAYYNSTEPPGHWALKKAFMQMHMSKYPQYRLLALANTFYNMEFMGSRYNPQLEVLISALSQQVPEIVEYRNGRKNFLQRTFVSATDASREKCQRTNTDHNKLIHKSISQQTTNQQNFVAQQNKHLQNDIHQNMYKPNTGNRNVQQHRTNEEENGRKHSLKSEVGSALKLKASDIDLLAKVKSQPGIVGRLVLFVHTSSAKPFHIISESATKLNTTAEVKTTGKRNGALMEYKLEIGNEILSTDFAESVKKARELLGAKLLETLQETCFTVVAKSQLQGQSVNKTEALAPPPLAEGAVEELIPNDNRGTRIMKLMGWSGQGLGKKEDGIQKPIQATKNVSRMGLRLGHGTDIQALQEKIYKHLRDYIREGHLYNLVFSNDFTNDERKAIHEVAQKLKLRSKSYGKKDERQLVVFKRLEPWHLVELLMANDDENANFKLIRPAKYSGQNIAKSQSETDHCRATQDVAMEEDDTPETNHTPHASTATDDWRQMEESSLPVLHEYRTADEEEAARDKPNTEKEIRQERNKMKQERKKIQKLGHPKPDLFSKHPVRLAPREADLLNKVKSQGGCRSEIVIFHHFGKHPPALQCIKQSVGKLNYTASVRATGQRRAQLCEYEFLIGNEVIVSDFFENQKQATEILGKRVLVSLEETCFSITVMTKKSGRLIHREDLQGNVANLFQSYVDSPETNNLVFNAEFTEKERKSFGPIADRFDLKHLYHAKPADSLLVVSKKFPSWYLVEYLLANGDESSPYKLTRPTHIK